MPNLDARGHRRFSAAEKKSYLSEYLASQGESFSSFSARKGLSSSTFYNWYRCAHTSKKTIASSKGVKTIELVPSGEKASPSGKIKSGFLLRFKLQLGSVLELEYCKES